MLELLVNPTCACLLAGTCSCYQEYIYYSNPPAGQYHVAAYEVAGDEDISVKVFAIVSGAEQLLIEASTTGASGVLLVDFSYSYSP